MAELGFFDLISIIKYPNFDEPIFDASIKRIEENTGQSLELIFLKDSPFKNFQGAFHFPDIVFAKLLLPNLFGDELVAFIDSGYLVIDPPRFVKWLKSTIESFESSELPIAMPSPPYSEGSRWNVAGGFILFNSGKYKELKILERLVRRFNELLPTNALQMPEQDLINSTIGEKELFAIQDIPHRLADLTKFAKLLNLGILGLKDLKGQYSLFKFVGSFKPWHLWVVNPDKQIFLGRIAEISGHLDLPLLNSISIFQIYPSQEKINWLSGQLMQNSLHLSSRPYARVCSLSFSIKCWVRRQTSLIKQLLQ